MGVASGAMDLVISGGVESVSREAIKDSDPQGRIKLPKKVGWIREAVGKLGRGAGG